MDGWLLREKVIGKVKNFCYTAALRPQHRTSSDVPEHRKSNDADRPELYNVAERWRLHCRVRTAFPAYNVAC